jgi:hypothetical protein
VSRHGDPATANGGEIAIFIALSFTERGGSDAVAAPGKADRAPQPRVCTALVEALARAFRWQRMLEEGVCSTYDELARQELADRGNVSWPPRLTQLAQVVFGQYQADDQQAPSMAESRSGRMLSRSTDGIGAMPEHAILPIRAPSAAKPVGARTGGPS